MLNNLYYQRLNSMISLFLILAIVMVYGQVGSFDFVDFDDGLYVTENVHVRKGLTEEGFSWAFTTSHAGNWHPITWLSHMLDCELYGLNPAGHHLTNVVFHIANTLLLFFLLFKITGAVWKSAFVATLFAVHPLHVESVAWVSERKDVLSTFFGLMMFFSYYRYVKTSDLKCYLMVLFFLLLGLMAKPMIVTFPFVLLLLDFWPLERFGFKNDRILKSKTIADYGFKSFFRLILEKIPLFILVFISSILTFLVQKSGKAVVPLEALSLKARAANALVSYISYVFKTIWPFKLSYYYPYPVDSLYAWRICGAAVLILSAIVAAIYLSRQYPYVLVGLLWYLGTLVPVIGLIQVSSQAMADRYTYVPLIGIFIIIAWGVPDLLRGWKFRRVFLGISVGIIVSVLAIRTFSQTGHWKNSVALFKNGVNETENNYHALINLGTALVTKGNYDEAALYFSHALIADPQRADAKMNMANLLFLKDKVNDAMSMYKEILTTDSQNADTHYNLAFVLATQKKIDEAVLHYREALNINPEYAKAHYELGNILIDRGKIKEAVDHFTKAIQLKPDYVQVYNKLGVILFRLGKLDKAKSCFSTAVRIDPNYSEARKNLERLNQILSTSR